MLAEFSEQVLLFIAQRADGDARVALNLLDACSAWMLHQEVKTVTIDHVISATNQRFVRYDKNGEEHYNLASAFQKSIVRQSAWVFH